MTIGKTTQISAAVLPALQQSSNGIILTFLCLHFLIHKTN